MTHGLPLDDTSLEPYCEPCDSATVLKTQIAELEATIYATQLAEWNGECFGCGKRGHRQYDGWRAAPWLAFMARGIYPALVRRRHEALHVSWLVAALLGSFLARHPRKLTLRFFWWYRGGGGGGTIFFEKEKQRGGGIFHMRADTRLFAFTALVSFAISRTPRSLRISSEPPKIAPSFA